MKLHSNNNNNDDHRHEVIAHKQSVTVLECFPPYFDFGDTEKQENDQILRKIVTRKNALHTRGSYDGSMNEVTSISMKTTHHISDKGNDNNITLLHTIQFLHHLILFFA